MVPAWRTCFREDCCQNSIKKERKISANFLWESFLLAAFLQCGFGCFLQLSPGLPLPQGWLPLFLEELQSLSSPWALCIGLWCRLCSPALALGLCGTDRAVFHHGSLSLFTVTRTRLCPGLQAFAWILHIANLWTNILHYFTFNSGWILSATLVNFYVLH